MITLVKQSLPFLQSLWIKTVVVGSALGGIYGFNHTFNNAHYIEISRNQSSIMTYIDNILTGTIFGCMITTSLPLTAPIILYQAVKSYYHYYY